MNYPATALLAGAALAVPGKMVLTLLDQKNAAVVFGACTQP